MSRLTLVPRQHCHRPLPALEGAGNVACQLGQEQAEALLVDGVFETAARQLVEQRAAFGERAGLDQRLRVVVSRYALGNTEDGRMPVVAVPIGAQQLPSAIASRKRPTMTLWTTLQRGGTSGDWRIRELAASNCAQASEALKSSALNMAQLDAIIGAARNNGFAARSASL